MVKADVPGLTAKESEATMTEDGVRITGERSKEKDYHRCEPSLGRFMRQVAHPPGVDRDKAQATSEDGVLEITFPLKGEAKQEKIKVKSA